MPWDSRPTSPAPRGEKPWKGLCGKDRGFLGEQLGTRGLEGFIHLRRDRMSETPKGQRPSQGRNHIPGPLTGTTGRSRV